MPGRRRRSNQANKITPVTDSICSLAARTTRRQGGGHGAERDDPKIASTSIARAGATTRTLTADARLRGLAIAGQP